MLVKVGKVWVNAQKVEGICPVAQADGLSIAVFTENGHEMLQEYTDECDIYATIINNALVSQSYGGEDAAGEVS